MSGPPPLFDTAARTRNRARAARAPVDILQQEAAVQVSERLLEVNRRFTDPAIIGPRAPLWAEVLRREGVADNATLVEDTEVLALREGGHDLIVHALALHGHNDPVGQLVQMRRALRPDGLMIAALFGGRSLSELRTALAEAETELTGGLSPRVAPMAEIRDLGALLQRTGYALPVADAQVVTLTYTDIRALVRDLRGMGEGNALSARRRTVPPRGLFARAGEIYAGAFPSGDGAGRIRATAEIVFLTGWCPSADQPQPLRPGSARARLADALGVKERPAGDRAGRVKPDD